MADILEYLDDLGRGLSEKMDYMTQKAVDMSEIRNLNRKIRAVKRENAEIFQEIGEIIYEEYVDKKSLDDNLTSLCFTIKKKEELIHSYIKKIAEIKKMEVCSSCGEFMPQDAVYCSKCGVKKGEKSTVSQETVENNEDKNIAES
ncbi:MAG: hypothetical protein ACLRVB_09170 [Blautia sp.]